MTEELDIRQYVKVILRHWKLLVFLTVLSALVGLIVSFLLPKVYEAKAVVVVTSSSHRILPILLDETKHQLPQGHISEEESYCVLNASTDEEKCVVDLNAQHTDAQKAARSANMWATAFVDRLKEYLKSNQSAAIVEAQKAETEEEIAGAQRALLEFQGRNQIMYLESLLEVKKNTLNEFLAYRESMTSERMLKSQQQKGSRTGNINALEKGIQDLVSEVQSIQQKKQKYESELTQLTRTYDRAVERHAALSLLLDELHFASQDELNSVQIVRNAVEPQEAISPRLKLNVIIAGLLGLLAGMFVLFALEYWRGGSSSA
ncbi:Wzz/FepE/Etk N-terminal domain-containing protein [Acidobacteriota bacterium]